MREALRVFGAVAFYWVTSLCAVYANKLVLNAFPLPLVVTLVHLLFSIAIILLLRLMTSGPCCAAPTGSLWNALFPVPLWGWDLIITSVPVGLCNAGMVLCNNLCLQLLPIWLYQISRSLTLPLTVLFSAILLKAKTSCACLVFLLVILLGFVLGTQSSIWADLASFSATRAFLLGALVGVASSCFGALNSVLSKRYLGKYQGRFHVGHLTWTTNLVSGVLILPLSMLFEGPALVTLLSEARVTRAALLLLLLSAACIYLLTVASFVQIAATSPVTHNVSGMAKASLQATLSLVFPLHTPASMDSARQGNRVQELAGVALCLVGSVGYALMRTREAAQTQEKPHVGEGGNPPK